MAIYNTAVLATNTTLLSGSGDRAITTIIVCNTTGVDKTLTLYAVQNSSGSAGTPAAGNMIVNALTIPAGDTVSFDQEKVVLTTGDSVVAVANATGLTATVSTLAV
jgi:hypothetical protein